MEKIGNLILNKFFQRLMFLGSIGIDINPVYCAVKRTFLVAMKATPLRIHIVKTGAAS